MSEVTADRDVCQGYANCVEEAPEVFALGDDGLVTVLQAQVGDEEQELVRNAARNCPVSALILHSE